jgi:hypothetical protein
MWAAVKIAAHFEVFFGRYSPNTPKPQFYYLLKNILVKESA